jgi:hypothetical protein
VTTRHMSLEGIGALMLAGCVTVISPTAPTTPAAPSATPPASPRAEATSVQSTATADDRKLDQIIRDALAKAFDITARIKAGDELQGFKDLAAHANTQLALVLIYRASPCTAEAVALFRDGMTTLAREAQAFVAWYEGGQIGMSPGSAAMTDSAQKLGGAVNSLNASTCVTAGPGSSSDLGLTATEARDLYLATADAFNAGYQAVLQTELPDEPPLTRADGLQLADLARAADEDLRALETFTDAGQLRSGLMTVAESPIPAGFTPLSWSLLVSFGVRDELLGPADAVRARLGLPARSPEETL